MERLAAASSWGTLRWISPEVFVSGKLKRLALLGSISLKALSSTTVVGFREAVELAKPKEAEEPDGPPKAESDVTGGGTPCEDMNWKACASAGAERPPTCSVLRGLEGLVEVDSKA